MAWQEPLEPTDRTFSVAEANGLIPLLEQELSRARRARRGIRVFQEDIRRASLLAESGGGSPWGALYLQALDQMKRALDTLQETGVLIKDLDAGLCDFPHYHEGRIVHLCWRLGESEVRWWHETTVGFQGRQSVALLDRQCSDLPLDGGEDRHG